MFKKILARFLAVTFLTGVFTGMFGMLAGCNTVEGAGKDIQKGGEAIKDEAREHKNY